MKTVALAVAVLLAGCTTTPISESNARWMRLQDNSEEIAHREQQCIHEAAIHSAAQIAQIAPDALAGLRTQMAEGEGNRELSECKANAARDNDALFARERAKYEGAAEEERDRSSLMMILTTSQPR
jgi:hypothetical protein